MGQEPASTFFSHVKPGDTEFKQGGLRDFFLYRDLGIASATNGKVIAHLVKANAPPTDGTGWHYHTCDFQIVVMMKGWAKFMYEDKVTWCTSAPAWCITCSIILPTWNIWRSSAPPISGPNLRRLPPIPCRPLRPGNKPRPGHDHSIAGTTPLGAVLSALMIATSRARYGLPSGCRMSWNQTTGGRST